MIVLSLFDGMSCGQIALERAGIKVDKYYSSEIDKCAIEVTQKNYPDVIQLGDIQNWKEWNIEKPDLILAGFPCQGFSFAGKQLNFDDPRSQLFFTLMDIVEFYSPKYYLFENVKMKIDYERVINERTKCYPIEINSALVSAQNRRRLYWTNIGQVGTDLFGNGISGIAQPKDKGILLKDILESEVNEKYYLSNTALKRIERKVFSSPKVNPGKTGSINTKNNSGQMSIDSGTTLISDSGLSRTSQTRNKKVDPLRANTGAGHNNAICIAQRGRGFNNGGKHYKKSPPLTSNSWEQNNTLAIRRLTSIECERLQTIPDNYTELGLAIHSQKFYNGNEWRNKCKQYVKSKNVISQSQTGKLNSVINTILDLPELVQLKNQENLLIKAKNVLLKNAKTNNKQLRVIALSIIKNGNEVNRLINQKNVRFALIQSGQDHAECVLSIITPGEETEILYKQKIENTNLMETAKGNIIRIKTVDGFIKLLLKRYSKENSKKVKLFIMLILINLIILKGIFMSVNLTQITYAYMDSLIRLQENSLSSELLSLEMGVITKISDTARYRCLGNGWTIDVIVHILKYMEAI
ncbi:DNA (cytosine-5-)-methyltransferase [Candidatus Pacearchaeota archaeon]|nr:DNA (cytosine-5-)-methyltransferase [Candidatus Pacearchaeota archaeon]